jgi:hypothetical protein
VKIVGAGHILTFVSRLQVSRNTMHISYSVTMIKEEFEQAKAHILAECIPSDRASFVKIFWTERCLRGYCEEDAGTKTISYMSEAEISNLT